jgi:mono/diheme cytochrome c family protein
MPLRRSFTIVAGGWLAAILISVWPMHAAGPAQQAPVAAPAAPQATFQRYCLSCHNQNLKERGTVPIAFNTLDLSNVGADADVWNESSERFARVSCRRPAGRVPTRRRTTPS